MPPPDGDDPFAAVPKAAAGWVKLLLFTQQAGRRLRRELATAADAVGASEQELLALWLCRYPPAAQRHTAAGNSQVQGSQGELAQWLGISPAQMSTVIERLRSHGWLSVQRQGLDRRRHHLEVSPAGHAALAAAAERLAVLTAELAARLALPAQESLLANLALLAEPSRPAAAGAAA